MILYGLIGYPLGHSFSHGYFARKFADEAIDARYDNYEIDGIEQLRAVCATPNLRGLNVTIPYKEQVMPLLRQLDPTAAEIGAVNVIDVPSMKGYNTDAVGFEQSLKPLLTSDHKRALVLGTGGASKAVCYALRRLGIDYTFVSRNAPREQSPSGVAPVITYDRLDEAIMVPRTLIINTTPVGMHPHTEECPPIPYELLTPSHLLYDLIYNPAETLFMRKGAERGCATKNGHEMLILQAEAAYKIWTNIKPSTL